MSAPITENNVTEPEGNAYDVTFEPYRPAAVVRFQRQPWWQRSFMYFGMAMAMVMAGGGALALLFWASATPTSSYSSYDTPSYYREASNPQPTRTSESGCPNGQIPDAYRNCVSKEAYAAAKAKAEKQLNSQLKDGKVDFTKWATEEGLKPKTKSAQTVVLTAYLCSAKPSENGKVYAADKLGDKTSTKYASVGDIKVALDIDNPSSVARDVCVDVPSWATPTPPTPSLAPKELAMDPHSKADPGIG